MQEEIVKGIKIGDKYRKTQLTMGILLIGVGMIGLVVGSGVGGLLGIGILNIIISSNSKNKDAVVIYKDYAEVKLAPLAARRFIKNCDITSIDTSKPKYFIVFYKENEKDKKLKVPKSMFNDDDYTYLSEYFNPKEIAA